MSTVFESDNLDEIEEFICASYAPSRLTADSDSSHRCEITRNTFGPINLDRVLFGFNVDYAVQPLNRIGLAVMESGRFSRVTADRASGCYGPDDVFLLTQPELPYFGHTDRVRFSYASLAPDLLSRVAGTTPGTTGLPVRLTDYQPVSPAAGRRLRRTIAFLRDHMMADPAFRDAPLVTDTASQLLAATVLSTFPSTALTEPTSEDRRDAHPRTVRRAIAFIDDHAQLELSVADIAAAAHVSVRALQYAFRRYCDTTPMGYLRQVRLQHAHEELLATDPTSGVTVTQIAARWGFYHSGRFAEYYRVAFGRSPYRTLQSHHD